MPREDFQAFRQLDRFLEVKEPCEREEMLQVQERSDHWQSKTVGKTGGSEVLCTGGQITFGSFGLLV